VKRIPGNASNKLTIDHDMCNFILIKKPYTGIQTFEKEIVGVSILSEYNMEGHSIY